MAKQRIPTVSAAAGLSVYPLERWHIRDFVAKAPGLSLSELWKAIDSDFRPHWCAEKFGGLDDFNILELGPAEGYNTAQLELLSGRPILAVEGLQNPFLRCLLIKNLLKLQSQFFLGDSVTFLQETACRYDLIYASGVFYHMTCPVTFLEQLAAHTDRVFLWTHFFAEDAIRQSPEEARLFKTLEPEIVTRAGRRWRYHHRTYDVEHTSQPWYQGGLAPTSCWMELPEIMAALEHFGFAVLATKDITFSDSSLPSICIAAHKKK